MIFGFKVNVKTLSDRLDKMAAGTHVDVPGPVQDGMVAASDVYHEAMRERFTEASNQDGQWKPLKPATEKRHAKIGDAPAHILHFTGELEESLKRDAPDHILETTVDAVIEGTQNPVARYHQDGAPVNNLPARPIYVEPQGDTLDNMKTEIVKGYAALIKDQTP